MPGVKSMLKSFVPIMLGILIFSVPALATSRASCPSMPEEYVPQYAGVDLWTSYSTFCGKSGDNNVIYKCSGGDAIIYKVCTYPCIGNYVYGLANRVGGYISTCYPPVENYRLKDSDIDGITAPHSPSTARFGLFDVTFQNSDCGVPKIGMIVDIKDWGINDWASSKWTIKAGTDAYGNPTVATCSILESTSTSVKWQCMISPTHACCQPLDPMQSGCSASTLVWLYAYPVQLATTPKPPNPNPLVHFSWIIDMFNNFVSWLKGLIPAGIK